MINPSQNQLDIAEKAIDWFYNSSDKVFQISGGPGTGKSFLLHYIVNQLRLSPWEVAPMAFTGAAAIVMRRKGFLTARTMHSWLLQPISKKKKKKNNNQGSLFPEEEVVMNEYFNVPEHEFGFIPKPLPPNISLVIVDEAKMAPLYLRKLLDLQDVKVLVAGDVDQLDPVASEPGYFMDSTPIHYLTEIFRQNQQSGIVWIANRIRNHLPVHFGEYSDCLVIYDNELTNDMILASDVLICGKNDTREILTKRVRNDILGIDSELPEHDERLVCRSNDWAEDIDGISLANGLMGSVMNYPDISRLKEGYFSIDFKPLMLDEVFEDVKINLNYFRAPFREKKNFKYDPRKYLGLRFEYGYAITTHISQGSEYSKGIYFEEFLNENINTQLHYTGITRFSNFCIYVKRRRRYY